jgi:hypothetical protein
MLYVCIWEAFVSVVIVIIVDIIILTNWKICEERAEIYAADDLFTPIFIAITIQFWIDQSSKYYITSDISRRYFLLTFSREKSTVIPLWIL